jgi:hypothetical protein
VCVCVRVCVCEVSRCPVDRLVGPEERRIEVEERMKVEKARP